MNLKDLNTIIDFALKYYNDFNPEVTINGVKLSARELVALSYFEGVTRLLINKQLLSDSDQLSFEFITVDSEIPEDDYVC